MNLKVLSQILSRRFVLAATKEVSQVEATLRYRGVFTADNIKVVEDIPAMDVAIHRTDVLINSISDDSFKPVMEIVGDSRVKMMIAFCLLYMGFSDNAITMWKNFLNAIQKLDNGRLNRPSQYNQIVFEYIWIMMSWLHDIAKPTPKVSLIAQRIQQHTGTDEEAMKKCWQKLNVEAGYCLEQRDYHLYAKDELFTVLWAQNQVQPA